MNEMNDVKKFLPERWYSLDTAMSKEKIIQSKETGNFIVGKIILWNPKKQIFKVDLGNGFIGILPVSEASIYPVLDSDGNLLSSAFHILSNNICVCVKDIANEIILSRKDNMLKAIEFFSNSIGKIVKCCITGFENYAIFLEVGFGIRGMLHIKDLTTSCFPDTRILGFEKNNSIPAKITSVDSENRIQLSYKDLFPSLSDSLQYGKKINVMVLGPINKKETGYFAYINPGNSAIINPPHGEKIPYGSIVTAIVRKPSKSHKIRLKFLRYKRYN